MIFFQGNRQAHSFALLSLLAFSTLYRPGVYTVPFAPHSPSKARSSATMQITAANFAYALYCASVALAVPTAKRQSGTSYDGGNTASDVENGGKKIILHPVPHHH